jgi:hypothetical protein
MKELISTFCSLVVRQAPGVLDGNFLTFDISKDISAVNRLVSSSRLDSVSFSDMGKGLKVTSFGI